MSEFLIIDCILGARDDRITCLHNIKLAAPVLREGKWKTDYNADFYPNYCTGPGMAFSRSGAQEILDVSKYTKSFDLDDVYISGILRFKQGLPLYHFKAVYVPELSSDFTLF